MRRRAVVLIAAVLSLAGSLVTAGSAAAAAPPTKRCVDGEVINHGYFAGVIVNNVSCSATSVKVEAGESFVLGSGSSLTANSSTFASTITVLGGSLSLNSSRVSLGGIWPSTTGAVSIAHSYVNGGIFADNSGQWGQASSFRLTDSVVQGNVAMEMLVPSLRADISGDRITRMLAIQTGDVTVEHTSIGTVADFDSPESLQMCGVHVRGAMSISYSSPGGSTYLGRYADPSRTCTGGVTVVVDGTLTIDNNAGPIRLANVIVAGDLVCSGNSGPLTIGQVIVGGTRQGQCA